jgi:hypothetical protein
MVQRKASGLAGGVIIVMKAVPAAMCNLWSAEVIFTPSALQRHSRPERGGTP